jgi:hypothetical protein
MSDTTANVPEAPASSPPLSPAPAESIVPLPTFEAPVAEPVVSVPTLSVTPALTFQPAKLPIPAARTKARTKSTNGSHADTDLPNPPAMGITESIASAPAPRPTDFLYDPNAADYEIDIEAALERASKDEDMPGSPTSKIMRAIAPPQAGMADVKWPTVSYTCQTACAGPEDGRASFTRFKLTSAASAGRECESVHRSSLTGEW